MKINHAVYVLSSGLDVACRVHTLTDFAGYAYPDHTFHITRLHSTTSIVQPADFWSYLVAWRHCHSYIRLENVWREIYLGTEYICRYAKPEGRVAETGTTETQAQAVYRVYYLLHVGTYVFMQRAGVE